MLQNGESQSSSCTAQVHPEEETPTRRVTGSLHLGILPESPRDPILQSSGLQQGVTLPTGHIWQCWRQLWLLSLGVSQGCCLSSYAQGSLLQRITEMSIVLRLMTLL